jgi:hypothetical protein
MVIKGPRRKERKKSVYQEDLTNINEHAPKNRPQVHEAQLAETENSMIKIRVFGTLLIIINRTTRQKISRNIYDINRTANQVGIFNIQRILTAKILESMLFSSTQGTCQNTRQVFFKNIFISTY